MEAKIKAWTFHKGFFYLWVLENEQMQAHTVPASAFPQVPDGNNVKFELSWPPKKTEIRSQTGLTDSGSTHETMSICKT